MILIWLLVATLPDMSAGAHWLVYALIFFAYRSGKRVQRERLAARRAGAL